MARPRSAHIQGVRDELIQRLDRGAFRPGERFLSNRALVNQFGVSYQTADRLIRELVVEKRLVRRAASGTYVPGRPGLRGVGLLFHIRARRKGSFGARLIAELTSRMDRERIEWSASWFDPNRRAKPRAIREDLFPVLWESPQSITELIGRNRALLLLNDRPASGMQSVYIDSVSVDDFSGGACAAQMLGGKGDRASGRFAVLAGPRHDRRSADRVAGFLSLADATVIAAANWFVEDGLKVAARAVRAGTDGIFCCNDRLAEAIVLHCGRQGIARPPLIGFDDAPIARELNLSTIAIPWAELAEGAMSVIRKRLAGDSTTASRQIFAPRPLPRGR